MQEQIQYLATIFPFPGYGMENFCDGPITEIPNVQISWRSSEVRIINSEVKVYSYNIAQFAGTSWIHLIGQPYCKIIALFSNIDEEPFAFRIYLVKNSFLQDILTKQVFMAFEYSLAECLKELSFITENLSKTKKKSFDLSPKTFEIEPSLYVNDGIYWNFNDFIFDTTKQEKKNIVIDPVYLVSNLTEHWRQLILDQINYKFPNGLLLLVTENPHAWLNLKSVLPIEIMNPYGIRQSFNLGIILTTKQLIYENKDHTKQLLSVITDISKCIYLNRNEAQIKKIINFNLVPKFPSFTRPLDTIKFSASILDNVWDSEIRKLYRNWIVLAYDEHNTRPTKLNEIQIAQISKDAPFLWPHHSNFVSNIVVPRAILRKFRIYGHHIKHSQTEKLIYKLFPFGCPLPQNQAVQRFSGETVPISVARELLVNHFSRLSSTLGEYSLPISSEISIIKFSFVESSLQDAQKACSICMDSLDNRFSFAICGHVYCNECSGKFFKDEFAQQKHKECAMCRTTLLSADVLNVDNEKEYVPALTSKQTAIQNFLKASKTTNIKSWKDFSFGGSSMNNPEEINTVKNLVVEKPFECSARSILDLFSDTQNTITFNVFYTNDEKKYFFNLKSSF
jgi:hypothetical protein